MPAAALIRRNALSRIKCIASAEPLLPFLYNTQTIRGQHSDALSDLESSLEVQNKPALRSRVDTSDRAAPRVRGKGVGSRDYERRARETDGGVRKGRKDADDFDASWEKPRQQYTKRVPQEHIPFEHAAQETISMRDKLASSTMTPSEKKAFEGLLSLSQSSDDQDKGKQKDKLNEVLDKASGQREKRAILDAKPMPEVLKTMQDKLKEDRSAAQRHMLDKAVDTDLEQVKKAFTAAQTDVELWKVLHDTVLSRVTSLDLDNLSPKPATKQKKRKAKVGKDPQPAESASPKWPGDIDDQLVITQTLPQHLIVCQRQLMYDMPASHLSTSLLPYLKSLGPTTFTLAASTDLYNLHLRALRLNGNFQAIIAALEEMEKEVYDFDDKTQDVMNLILQRAKPARTGLYGAGVAALWNGERSRKTTRSINMWSRTISARMQEKALKEARAKEEEEANKQAEITE